MKSRRDVVTALTIATCLWTAMILVFAMTLFEVNVPAMSITVEVPTVPPLPTWTPVPTPTPRPTATRVPTLTPLPWRYCHQAAPGEICIPSTVLTPSPTPTFPTCGEGITYVGEVRVCVKPGDGGTPHVP